MALRKKHYLIFILVAVLAAFIFYICFVPKTYRQRVDVPYTMLKTGEQLNNPRQIVKWYFPFTTNDSLKQALQQQETKQIILDDHSLEILSYNTISTIIKTGYANTHKEFLFAAVSDSTMESCNVTLTYKSTLFNKWFNTKSKELVRNAVKSLENLKDYMEDTQQFYGYQIEQTTVADTSFIFLSTTVPVAEKREATKKLFDRLINYAKKREAGYNGTRIFYSVPYGDGQIMLFASIGVTNRIDIPESEEIQYKKMPFGKNLLMATYQGPYGEVSKVYTALENFKSDHKLSSMAIPYQKFLSEGYDFADDQIVQMKVYYPIF
jgi:effector-binding domain-containing protein